MLKRRYIFHYQSPKSELTLEYPIIMELFQLLETFMFQ